MTVAWRALHVFIGARAHGDALVLVADRVLRAHARDPSDWFFIRYGEAGAHLRFRLGPGVHAAEDALRDVLGAEATRLARRSPDPDWTERAGYRDGRGRLFAPGHVAAIAYEPEVQRYGGHAALQVSEALFRHSSAIAVRAIALTPDFAARPAVAVDLMLAAAAATADADAAALFAGYARGWSRLLAAVDERVAVDAAAGARLRGRLAALRAVLAAGSPPDSLGAHWAVAVRDAVAGCGAIAARGDLVAPWSGVPVDADTSARALGDIVLSHVHMFANRLGYSPYDELRWSRYLAAALR